MEAIILKMIVILVVCVLLVRINLILTVLKLSILGQFPYWRKINWSLFSNKISVSAHNGYKENPSSVENWDFDLSQKTARFWVSVESSRTIFEGSLEQGLEKICEKKSFLLSLLVHLFKNITFLTFVGGSIILALVMLWQLIAYSDFTPTKVLYSTDYPFWWGYTHSFDGFMGLSALSLLLFLILTFVTNEWRTSERRL